MLQPLRAAGHHVVLACRSMERCAAAQAELEARGLPGSSECRHLDLNDWGSIRRFAAELKERPPIAAAAAAATAAEPELALAAGAARGRQQLAAAPMPAAGAPQPGQPRLSLLVNNAGVMGGVADHLRPNHFGERI